VEFAVPVVEQRVFAAADPDRSIGSLEHFNARPQPRMAFVVGSDPEFNSAVSPSATHAITFQSGRVTAVECPKRYPVESGFNPSP
jgi:hypothetical protein